MKICKQILLCLSFVVSATSAFAQTPTAELRAYPPTEVGLWKTVAFDPPESGAVTFLYAGSADEACRLQHQTVNPNATYQGVSNSFDSDIFVGCNWLRYLDGGPVGSNTTIGIGVQLICPDNYVYRGGVSVQSRLSILPICNNECGSSPISGTPQPNIGNPININSGLKVLNETDYSSADGLFSVNRQYISRAGYGWQTLLPGYLEMGGQFDREVTYHTRGGGRDEFISSNLWDQNDWTFTLPNFQGISESVTRRRLSMVTVPAVGRGAFIRDLNVSPTGPAEMRLDMANGEYILFRRANVSFPSGDRRRLVPIEQGKPGGYKIWFDYNDTGVNPFRIRDSLNREMLLTWADAPGPANRVSVTGAKVISRIQLPDTTQLDYTYDETASSFIMPIPAWATQLGSNVRGPTAGSINVTIRGRKDRLRSVTRRAATGAILAQHQFDYEYNLNPSALTRIRDQTSATLTEYTYTSGELLASSRLAGGLNAHVFEHYDLDVADYPYIGILRRILNPLNRIDDYRLFRRGDGAAEATTLTQIDRLATPTTPADYQTFEYSSSFIFRLNQMMTKSVDQLGRETLYTVDDVNRRPSNVTEAAGTASSRPTVLGWHPVWDLPTRIERDGVRVDITYTPDAMVSSQTITDLTNHGAPYPTNGQTRTTNYVWGANARLLSVNGPRGLDALGRDDIVSFVYDMAGNVTSMTNALAHTTTFANYDANGRPATMTDANGAITQFAYDLMGRTSSVNARHPTTATLDAITTFTYDIEGRVKTVTAPASTSLTMNYDLAGLLKSIVASNGERIDYNHDGMGNITSQVTRRTNGVASNTITNTFDALGRLLTETLGPNRKWTYAYDKVGNLTNSISPRNQSTAYSFDALDRLVSSAMPDGGAPTLGYDQRDNLTEARDPISVKTTFVRNGFGEVIQEVSPERGTSIYYYDSAGDKTAAIDGRGQRIDYSYDILGRLITATPVANPTVTYTWDTAVIAGSFANGRLSRVVDSGTTIEYRYDHRGNVTTKRQRIDTGPWMQLAFTYDLADRRTQITYPSGRIVNYSFNTLGRVTQVRTKASSAITAWTTLASGMTYESFGAITRANYGNGLRMIQSWGNDGRLANRRLERNTDSVRLSSLTYAYDNNDNFTAIADTLDATKSRTYAYDPMDRLTRITGTPGPFAREDFIYDDNGNRLAVERRTTPTSVAATQTDIYTIAPNTNRLTSLTTPSGTHTFTHDGVGNQAVEQWPDGSVITVAYDGFARLTRYKVGLATQDMLYNGADERIRVVTTPAVGLADTRIYMYDLDHRIIGEYGVAGVSDVKAEYIWTLPEVGAAGPTGGDDGTGGYLPLAIVTGATADINWVHSHHNAKPILLTNSTGAVVAYIGHAVLGFPGQFANAVGLAGAQYYYNRYRDYNDTTGRYIQADPIGQAGDANPYAYALGNALRFSDPTGEFVPMLVGIALGAGLEALTNPCASPRDIILAGALGGLGGGIGKLALLRHGPRALTREIGREWSHGLSRKWVDRNTSGAINRVLNRRGGLNGSWVTPQRHFRHDLSRSPSGRKQMGDRLPDVLRGLDRIPDWMKASAGSGLVGAGIAGGDCGC